MRSGGRSKMAVINVLAVDREIKMEFVLNDLKLGLLSERWRDFPC